MNAVQEEAQPAPDARPTRVRWLIFFLMLFMITVNYVDRSAIGVAMPLIGKDFHWTPTIEGFVLSAFFWPYALMQIPGGMLADRFGPRKVISACIVVWGVFEALTGAAIGIVTMYIARLGLGAAEAPILPAGGKLNGIWMTRTERSRGATLMDSGGTLGTAIGALVVSALIGAFASWRAAFFVTGLATVACVYLAWYYMRDKPHKHPRVNKAELELLAANAALEAGMEGNVPSGSEPTSRKHWYQLFRYRTTWGLFFGWMSRSILFYGLMTWAPSYLEKARGFDLKQMGGAIFIIFFAGFIGELIGGALADFWRKRSSKQGTSIRVIIGVAAVIAAVATFLVTVTSDRYVAVALLSVTLFFLSMAGLFWTIPSMVGTRRSVGTVGGIMNLGSNLSGIVIPTVAGVILQLTGNFGDDFIMFAIGGVGLFICSVFVIDYEHKLPV